jgi:hypothetical protein
MKIIEMVNKNRSACENTSLPDRKTWYTDPGERPNGPGESHGNTFAGAQLPAVPLLSRVLGSPLSPGLFRIQNQKPEAAQPCSLPGNRKTLSGLRKIHEDQIAMNLVDPRAS